MINKIILVGRLGKDPEKRSIPSGAVYVRFSVATNESYKDRDGNWQDKTEWHNVIMWREMAERAERQLKKGHLVYIEGKLTHRSWQDENGNTKNMTEISVQLFRLLEKRESTGDSGGYNMPPPTEPSSNTTGGQEQNATAVDSDDDDLPF